MLSEWAEEVCLGGMCELCIDFDLFLFRIQRYSKGDAYRRVAVRDARIVCCYHHILHLYHGYRDAISSKDYRGNTTEDLLPFDRYAYASYGMVGFLILALVGAICYRPFLYCVGAPDSFFFDFLYYYFLGYGYNMILRR